MRRDRGEDLVKIAVQQPRTASASGANRQVESAAMIEELPANIVVGKAGKRYRLADLGAACFDGSTANKDPGVRGVQEQEPLAVNYRAKEMDIGRGMK